MLNCSSRYLALLIASMLLVASGCPSKPPATTDGTTPTNNVEVQPRIEEDVAKPPAAGEFASASRELIAKMQKAYAEATAYSDNGVLRWQYIDGGTWQPITTPFSTTYARPNKLSLQVRGLHVVSDGQMLRAIIKEEATGDYDGQMLERKTPPTLQVADLYGDAEMANILGYNPDPEVGEIVDSTPWPLRLLTGDAIVADFLTGDIGEMSDQPIDGKNCRRVRIRYQNQAATLWIDPESFLLRRVELPHPDPKLGVRAFIADFTNAKLNGDADTTAKQFQLARPPAAKLVTFFVAPPIAIDIPSPLFGKAAGEFQLETGDGRIVKRDDLIQRATVLVWFLENDASRATLLQLQAVADKLKGDPAVQFYAVSPLPDAVTSESIAKSLTDMGVKLPLLRDTTAVGRDVFDITGAPTVVVLDREHRVQAYKAGTDPNMPRFLPILLDSLIAGKNPAGQLRNEVAAAAARYRQQLASARADANSTVLELTETPLAPQRDPAKLKLTKLWTSRDVKQPGNITVINTDNGQPRILVHDHENNWRTIVELDATGKTVARRELPAPTDAAIAVLRTAVDKQGKRWYAGSARFGKQVYVFNEAFELAYAYPTADVRAAQVGDFALVDFQGDGELQLCVGFWDILGTHGVDMQGQRKWTNRTASPVVGLATSPPNDVGWRQVLATTDHGEIFKFNGFGKNDPPTNVEGRAITQLISSGFTGDTASAYLGVAMQASGASTAVVLSPELEVRWDMPLPAGAHRNQIQAVTSGQLLPGDVGEWVVAGADGSIGIVADDATFFDSFTTGQRLSGVAIAMFDADHVLLLSTPTGVTAWKVQALAGPSR